MKYESNILKRLIDTYGVVGNPRYISEIIKEFIVQGKERFPDLFTYQADWLAHIDEFGLNPSYSVSYTGQSIYAPNTLERPVKSAILKGQTLVNLLDRNNMSLESLEYTFVDGIFNVTTDRDWGKMTFNPTLISNKKYILFIGSSVNNCMIYYRVAGGVATSIGYVVNAPIIFTTPSEQIVSISIEFPTPVTNGTVLYPMLLEYQEGMENWDIPYFEGMQSVKMPVLTTTGKNLFNPKCIINDDTKEFLSVENDGSITLNGTINIHKWFEFTLPKGTYYPSSNKIGSKVHVFWLGEDAHFDDNKSLTYETTTKIKGYIESGTYNNENFTLQLEYGTQATSYEPYKTNILTVNEDVTLRGIGDVQDTLDCLTGEVTERIVEFNFNRNYVNNVLSVTEFENVYRFNVVGVKGLSNSYVYNSICDKFKIDSAYTGDYEHAYYWNDSFYFFISKSKIEGTVEAFKTYITNNPIKFQTVLATESIKTVDLNILDQNGQNVKQLMSFNGGTHFNTGSAEGSPLPVVSVSVETDLEETLRVCSLEGNTM